MRLISLKIHSLRDVFVQELRNIYNAETQIVDALPKMAEAASAGDLRAAFEQHLTESRKHLTRLETVFDMLQEPMSEETSEGIKGIISEGKDYVDAEGDSAARDAALIGAAQKVEHYEIAAYGTLRSLALRLGFTSQAELLQQTLDEEGATDRRLTAIAEGKVNVQATEAR